MELTLTGLWLLAVGAGDLLRATGDATTPERRLATIGAGSVVLGLGILALEVDRPTAVLLWFAGILALGLWVLGSATALERPTQVGSWVAAVGLAGGTLAAFLAGGEVAGPDTWGGGLDDTLLVRWSVAEVVMALGAVASQLATANIVVRLVLDAVGVGAAPNEQRLKGGRLLGPLERLFIVGLGAAGELAAAAVVVGAKGLLRFPEVQRGVRDEPSGPSDVTEYFLIGSFISWLLALGAAGLVLLA